MTTTIKTKSQEIATDLGALLRARNPLLWIVTREEARVERYIFEAAAAANYRARTWDISQGIREIDGKQTPGIGESADPEAAMGAILARATVTQNGERSVWIMRDLPVWLAGPPGARTMRTLRNLARALPGTARESAQAIVILSPSADVPPELTGHTTVIEWPLPDREEIADILDSAIESLPEDIRDAAAPNGTRDAAIDAAIGLSGEEAAACFAKSLVQLRKIDPATIAREKKRVVARSGVLEWYDPLPGGMAAVGGLENLKAWLLARTAAYSPEARAYGLPAPKGAMVAGIPGTGKSLTAKAIATAWGIPSFRLDLGALKSKFVGESEGNLRKAFDTIKAIGRCVVWLDEIEKALQGATSGSSDGGVSADALGAILSWMQERQGEAFVIATANDVESLPPELLRKGRFDEVWWVDLPTLEERGAILMAALRTNGRADIFKSVGELASVAQACDGFTGSEIAALVPEAMFVAFADGKREITAADLKASAQTVTPLSKTAAAKIQRLRDWAKDKARPASAGVATQARTNTGRALDI